MPRSGFRLLAGSRFGHQISLPGGAVVGGPMINPRAPGSRAALALGMRGYSPWGRSVGDPGLLGSIVKGIGKVAGAVVRATPLGGAITSAIDVGKSLLGGTQRIGAPSSRALGVTGGMNLMMPQPPAPGLPMLPDPEIYGGGGGAGTPTVTVGAGSPGTSLAGCGLPGYRMNKSGYWKNTNPMLPGASWIAPGTVCVKSRRMNPFNPRAASRAMSRLASLSKGMKALDKRLSKMARGAGARRSSSGRCGCKKR